MSISEPVKTIIDGLSLANVVAVFISLIPHLTAIFSLIWVVIRIYETHTFQRLILRKQRTRKTDLKKVVEIADDAEP